MARSKTVVVGDLTFHTKASAKDFFRSLRDQYQDGERLTSEDQSVILDLLGLHPESSSKIGCGVAWISVATEQEFGRTRHFVVHRIDNSSTDFSFHSCIDGRSVRRDIIEALRRAVAGQIVDFQREFFGKTPFALCVLSGKTITRDSYHVDHAPPRKFMVLVEGWLCSESLVLEQVEITPPADLQIVAQMTSSAQRESWTEYHLEQASLRMLSPLGNLSHANRSTHC